MGSKGTNKVNPERMRQCFSAEFKREAVRLNTTILNKRISDYDFRPKLYVL
ncbi:hypothetical protein SAMN05216309_10583 [Nitrosomonas europaea]|nr:hypothetical protein SAMN05216310_10583 [Nitrosomonas europaea]SES82440.1 hypothetical protein SAMN05216309_10583 [Nitrosomonas europaea]SJZ37627.1 hypothetical protein SAMN02745113_00695 [Nitrosomonas europaea]